MGPMGRESTTFHPYLGEMCSNIVLGISDLHRNVWFRKKRLKEKKQ